MHRESKRAGRRGPFAVALALAAALAAILSIGVPAASATCTPAQTSLTLTPATQTHAVGQTATVTATAKCGTAPLTNRPVFFKVVSGPNINKTFTANTNASGIAVFKYTSAATGTDKVGAKLDAVWKCCVDVIWTSTKPPLRYTGDAYNAAANVGVPLLGTVTLNPVNRTGPVDTTSATNVGNEVLDLNGTLLDAKVLQTGVKTGSGSSTAFAKTAGASLAPLLGIVPAITNIDVLAESSATCAAKTGKTTIASLKIGNTVIVGAGGLFPALFTPAPNTTVNLGALKITLNEQVLTPNKIAVNAVRVQLLAPIVGTSVNVIVSHSESDIHNC